MSNQCNCCSGYQSSVEQAILNAHGEPAITEQNDLVSVNSQTGLWANKSEADAFSGPVPLSQYPINNDPCPQILNKIPNNIECHREVSVKYLEPGQVPEPGPIIINQAQNILCPTAPPVVIRQLPSVPCTPEPLIVREAPPQTPCPPPEKVITIPGELLPPPPRKVVIERLPELPDKPQDIHIERWLPFKDVKRQVILNPKPADPIQCKPKNIIINWQKRQCSKLITEVQNLGVEVTDPIDYAQHHGCTLLRQCQMPHIAHEVRNEHGQLLACDDNTRFYMELEGDIEGLKLLDLDAEGLSEYAYYLNNEPKPEPSINYPQKCCNHQQIPATSTPTPFQPSISAPAVSNSVTAISSSAASAPATASAVSIEALNSRPPSSIASGPLSRPVSAASVNTPAPTSSVFTESEF